MNTHLTWAVVPAIDSDLEQVARLVSEDLGMPRTADDVRESDALHPKDGVSYRAKAIDVEGAALGFVTVRRWPYNPEGQFWIMLVVDPLHTGKGVGNSLLLFAEDFALRHGATHAISYMGGSDAGRAFAATNGYAVVYENYRNELDLADFSLEPFQEKIDECHGRGIELMSYSDWGDSPEHRRSIWEVCMDGEADCPDTDLGFAAPFDEFEREHFASGKDQRNRFVAVLDGRAVATTSLEPKDCGKWVTDFTCTARSARGQGLSTLLKAISIADAKARGASRIVTVNDKTNVPMLATNARLGFRPEATTCTIRKDFPPKEES